MRAARFERCRRDRAWHKRFETSFRPMGLQSREMTAEIVERFDADPRSPLWGEHRSRYHFAGKFAAGKIVLDIACGTGFGAAILRAHGARGVIGFDLSWDALLAVRAQPALFCCADGTVLPLANQTLDVVTSFETVEHIPRYGDFVGELARILKPDGTLILSTPNALITKPVNGTPRNPFHVHEFTPDELRELLGRHFASVTLHGQRPSPRNRPCPYWEGNDAVPEEPPRRMKRMLWKATARLPEPLRDPLWRRIHGTPLFPREHDWIFAASERDIAAAHALVAVCRK